MWQRVLPVLLMGIVAFACHRHASDTAGHPTPPVPRYKLGETVKFGRDGTSLLYKRGGWGDTERDMTWTNGHAAGLEFLLPETAQPLRLRMRLEGFIDPPRLNFQTVQVLVNDESVAEWQVSSDADYVAIIPADTANHERLIVTLLLPEAVSPKAVGKSDDTRMLGVACANLDITAAKDAAPSQPSYARSTAIEEPKDWQCPLGTWIQMGLGTGGQRYKVSGWYPAERDFTWTARGPAVLRLGVPSTGSGYRFTLRASGLTAPGKLVAQPTEVYVNGEKVGDWEVGNLGEYHVNIAPTLCKDGNLQIEFRCPRATSPAALASGSDTRELGIRCERFQVDALPPNGARESPSASPSGLR